MPYGRKSRTQYSRKTGRKTSTKTKIPPPCPGSQLRSNGQGSGQGRGRGKGPIGIPVKIKVDLEEGELKKHGYRMSSKEATRHMALGKAVHEDGGLTVFHRLQLLIQYNKQNNPTLARIARKDRDWVKKRYYRTKHWRE